jgi:hypothetical protein
MTATVHLVASISWAKPGRDCTAACTCGERFQTEDDAAFERAWKKHRAEGRRGRRETEDANAYARRLSQWRREQAKLPGDVSQAGGLTTLVIPTRVPKVRQ